MVLYEHFFVYAFWMLVFVIGVESAVAVMIW
jgi:hypothetical protein